ncbi:hypothetical protein CERZMDRAFT_81149 [Cercospora zeae-maydis SCOH1-5]|uniref:Uncharacterized protein n=1 Tax=Cercospora zeae-maydis SCOH1-5 TaxID=717836 RepID=A0A6A6FUZ7_9PEZI|nr:hypothetical protein CERZMDRAFT_81149 [Cercospora zeae-maydis SCOH1-5]
MPQKASHLRLVLNPQFDFTSRFLAITKTPSRPDSTVSHSSHHGSSGKTYKKLQSRLLLASASRELAKERLAIPHSSSARLALSSTTSTNVNGARIQHINRTADLCALPHPDTSLFHEHALRCLRRCLTADEPASQSFRQAQNFDPHSREAPLLWLVGPNVKQARQIACLSDQSRGYLPAASRLKRSSATIDAYVPSTVPISVRICDPSGKLQACRVQNNRPPPNTRSQPSSSLEKQHRRSSGLKSNRTYSLPRFTSQPSSFLLADMHPLQCVVALPLKDKSLIPSLIRRRNEERRARIFRRQYVERTKYIFKSRSSSDIQSGCDRKPSRSGAGFVRRSPVDL